MQGDRRTAYRVASALAVGFALLGPTIHPWGILPGVLPALYASQVAQILFWGMSSGALLVAGAFLWSRSRPRAFGNLVLLLATCLVSAGLAEAMLRLVDPARKELPLFRPPAAPGDPYSLQANLDLTVVFDGAEVSIRTNDRGMRWREVAPPGATRGRRRIAVLGDSFTFGLWSDDIATAFVSVFESRLDPADEVLNFGVPGYGLADVSAQLARDVLPLEPTHVVLAMYTGNDLLDTYLGPHRYDVDPNGVLRLDEQVLAARVPAEFRSRSEGRNILQSMATIQVASLLVNRLLPELGESVRAADRNRSAEGSENDYSSDLFWSRVEYPPFAREARDATLETLGGISDILAERGVDLMIMMIPSIDQVTWVGESTGVFDVRYPQLYVERFAAERAIPYLDLLSKLQGTPVEGEGATYHASDGHFANAGHRMAGEALAQFFSAHF